MSTSEYKTKISFSVDVEEGTTLRQLNWLWNKMADVAQGEPFVSAVDMGGGSEVSFVLQDDTDALEADQSAGCY